MTSLTGEEPDLELGASGEDVMLLQVRLYQLGIYRQVPDGTYDSVTENAVRELQSQLGLDNDGEVHRETWEAVVHQEQQAGIVYQYQSPYDALAQIRYELDHPAEGGGLLSEDGQWRWDGTDWQPADGTAGGGTGGGTGGEATAYAGSGEISPDGQWQWNGYEWAAFDGSGSGAAGANALLSDDGQWRWDGTAWQPADGTGGTDGAAGAQGGLLSDDGQWRWDGNEWRPA